MAQIKCMQKELVKKTLDSLQKCIGNTNEDVPTESFDKKLFEDSEFSPSDFLLDVSESRAKMAGNIEWLRPRDIKEDAQFIVEGISRFDAQQGKLGDCWLIAAISALAENEELFEQVVPKNQSFEQDYTGKFHFRFWQYGKFIDVEIDDRLPTYKRKLIYMKSSVDNEFWSALLEKAYAKLHGSYGALVAGDPSDAMVDFTGGFTLRFSRSVYTKELFDDLFRSYQDNSMIICNTDEDNSLKRDGIVPNHAYSITKVEEFSIETTLKIKILCLRNPWHDEMEWNGPWSDNSIEWVLAGKQIQEKMNFKADGEFWMSFNQWKTRFASVQICRLDRAVNVVEGEWTAGSSAGGCRKYENTYWKNPQYMLTFDHKKDGGKRNDGKIEIIVGLMQKNRRSIKYKGMNVLSIGFEIYNVSERDPVNKPFERDFFKKYTEEKMIHMKKREVIRKFVLNPGKYLIVPSTNEQNEECEFLIRLFYDECSAVSKINRIIA